MMGKMAWTPSCAWAISAEPKSSTIANLHFVRATLLNTPSTRELAPVVSTAARAMGRLKAGDWGGFGDDLGRSAKFSKKRHGVATKDRGARRGRAKRRAAIKAHANGLAWRQPRMPKSSAGILLFRRSLDGVEVLLAPPGGPFRADSWRFASVRLVSVRGEPAAVTIDKYCLSMAIWLGPVRSASTCRVFVARELAASDCGGSGPEAVHGARSEVVTRRWFLPGLPVSLFGRAAVSSSRPAQRNWRRAQGRSGTRVSAPARACP